MNNPTVVDTNVFVSGLISSQLDSPPSRIVDEMLRGRFNFLLSLDLLSEYRIVLLRPKVQAFHRLTEKEVDTILTTITSNGMMREPRRAPMRKENPGDQHIWNLAEEDTNVILVTGDYALMKSPPSHITVLSPQQFVSQILNPHH